MKTVVSVFLNIYSPVTRAIRFLTIISLLLSALSAHEAIEFNDLK